MNLFEYEGKNLLKKYDIKIPRGKIIKTESDLKTAITEMGLTKGVVKAQILSGGRGKVGGIKICESTEEIISSYQEISTKKIKGQIVSSILLEEKLEILEEHYLSIVYDTNKQQPMLVYSKNGGVEIESVPKEKILFYFIDPNTEFLDFPIPFANNLWQLFIKEDLRLVEINPLVKTTEGQFVAVDAKIAIDDDASFRHKEWNELEPRTVMGREATKRELAVKKIDEGESYYRGTAGKYIELDGDIAVLFSGGGASIANMDALIQAGGQPANYTEYSGNPPREKVYALTKIVLSKSNLKGLWIAGGVANFTDIAETFQGIVDALDEIKPNYPIVVRRAGPNEKKGLEIMRECAKHNNLNIKLFGKETPMSETAKILVELINK